VVLPDSVPREDWDAFVEFRRGTKFTPHAQQLAIDRLIELAGQGHPPGDVLRQSIMNGWRGLFPLKGSNHDQHNGNRQAGRGYGGGFAHALGHLEQMGAERNG
jgi:hypothetical protein